MSEEKNDSSDEKLLYVAPWDGGPLRELKTAAGSSPCDGCPPPTPSCECIGRFVDSSGDEYCKWKSGEIVKVSPCP